MAKISFVTLLSYDYELAFKAIESYYDIADEIILGIDGEQITWSGNKFDINFRDCGNFVMRRPKIKMVKGNFHSLPRPIDNDTAERRFLSAQCKPDNWIIQIDADEMMLNPIEFNQFLDDNADTLEGCALKAHWITVFKTFDNGKFLVIDADGDTDGRIFVGTKLQGKYIQCRDTDETAIQTPLRLLHVSWGRSKEELKKKLENWGHSKDFDTNAFLEMWDKVTLENYQQLKDFHPLHGPHWAKLKLVEFDHIMKTQGEPK